MWQGERLTDQPKVEALAPKVKGKPARFISYEVKETKEYPFILYDLTLLQREAKGKFAFSAKKMIDTAQSLYEKHKGHSVSKNEFQLCHRAKYSRNA